MHKLPGSESSIGRQRASTILTRLTINSIIPINRYCISDLSEVGDNSISLPAGGFSWAQKSGYIAVQINPFPTDPLRYEPILWLSLFTTVGQPASPRPTALPPTRMTPLAPWTGPAGP